MVNKKVPGYQIVILSYSQNGKKLVLSIVNHSVPARHSVRKNDTAWSIEYQPPKHVDRLQILTVDRVHFKESGGE